MGKSSHWTLPAIVELAVAGVLVLLGLVFLYLGVQDHRLASAAVSAFEAYDANDTSKVAGHCADALEIDPTYHPARQLFAKMYLEQESPDLDSAEKEYRALLAGGYAGPNAHVGLGVIALLRAGREEDAAAAANWIKTSRHAFQDAGEDCLEAGIGLAHVALLENLKSGRSLEPVRRLFQKILSRLEKDATARASITRDGLVDLYAGLGRSACDPSVYREEAAMWIHTSHYYAPDWILPLVNLVCIDAQKYATRSFTRETIQEEKPAMRALALVVEPLLAQHPALKEAHLHRQLAIALAFSRAGDLSEFQSRIRRLRLGLYPDRIEPLQTEVLGLAGLMRTEGLKSSTLANYLTKTVEAIDRLWKHGGITDNAERVTLLNNSGVFLFRLGVLLKAPNRIREGEKRLKEALKLDPENRLVNRNLSAIKGKIKR